MTAGVPLLLGRPVGSAVLVAADLGESRADGAAAETSGDPPGVFPKAPGQEIFKIGNHHGLVVSATNFGKHTDFGHVEVDFLLAWL